MAEVQSALDGCKQHFEERGAAYAKLLEGEEKESETPSVEPTQGPFDG